MSYILYILFIYVFIGISICFSFVCESVSDLMLGELVVISWRFYYQSNHQLLLLFFELLFLRQFSMHL